MKHLVFATALALAIPSLAGVRNDAKAEQLRFLPKAQSELRNNGFGSTSSLQDTRQKAPRIDAVRTAAIHNLPTSDLTGYLDGPDGSTWFYTMDYDKDIVDHGAWKETVISGYSVTVYDAGFNEIGKISDTITLQEGETRVAQVEVGPQITKKFFNVDNNYEIMVVLSINTSEYVNHEYTKVYSIGKEESLMTIPGYYVSAVNSATDAWSEKFWITFMTTEESETSMVGEVLNPADYVFTVYKYAGYSGMGDPVLTARIPTITVGGENSVPFLANVSDGKPWFLTNRLKYSWFENPYDFENENPTADNELIVDLYTLPTAYAQNVEKYSTTRIPSDATADNHTFLYVGAFSYMNDLSFGRYTTDGEPSLIITTEKQIPASDGYTYSYAPYTCAAKDGDAQGQKLFDLAEDVISGYFLADIEGYDPQVMFIRQENDSFAFDFTNLLTGEVEQSMPHIISDGVALSASTERVAGGDSYLYVSASAFGHSDNEGNVWTDVTYIDREGKIDHIDSLNMGKNIEMAQVYVAPDAFNPYTFNLDDNREYMVLAKRGQATGGTREELLVISSDPDKGVIFKIEPDEEKGALASIFFSNLSSDTPRLAVIFGKDSRYTTVAYELPFELFEQGDGTAGNPYVITTAGGLGHLKTYPDAYFVLGNDIDASGHVIAPSNYEFHGSLNGMGHTISNLKLTGRALIPAISGPQRDNSSDIDANTTGVVRDIVLINPALDATSDDQALIAGDSRYGIFDNIMVYGAEVNGRDGIAGLVGRASLYTMIRNCSVNGDITAESGSAAGIARYTRTGSTILACSFSGNITGDSEIGGIAGAMESNSGVVSNCHVNAAIKGRNTIGGIAGSNDARARIEYCHVEGSIQGTEAPRWGGGPSIGGVTGRLQGAVSSMEGNKAPADESPAVIEGCVVNLEDFSFTGESGYEAYPGQNDTMHRIVGRTCANDEPEILDYDDDWEPIYSDTPAKPDNGLKNNYVSSAIAKISESIADEHTTTEGKSIESDELTRSFLENIGFRFGENSENPWSLDGENNALALYFEADAPDLSGIEKIENIHGGAASAISFDGTTLTASGTIHVHDMTGALLASGSDRLDISGLTSGVYIAVANGKSLKFFKK